MPDIEITNMVMIEDPATGRFLVQDRIKKYPGISFPGGHAEGGESIYDSAVREVKEETGLTVSSLTLCGFIYWYNNVTEDKYFTYFYKTSAYEGELLPATEEGRVFFATMDEILQMKHSQNFHTFLPILTGQYREAYCVWNEDMPENEWDVQYR